MKIFCIDGVVVETDYQPSRADLDSQDFMPIEDQPIMAGVLPRDISMLSPDTSVGFTNKYGGWMIEDRNTESFADVSDALARQEGVDIGTTEWPP